MQDAVFNLTVSAVGAGILVLPYSFRCTGLLLGIIMLSVVALCSLQSLSLLETASRLSDPVQYSFEDVGRVHGGIWMQRAVQINLALLLLFGALTTLVILAANLLLPVLALACGGSGTCFWAQVHVLAYLFFFLHRAN
jgi:amino acid permease